MRGSNPKDSFRRFFVMGEPMVWLAAMSFATILLLIFMLLAVVVYNGAKTFWPAPVAEYVLKDGQKFWGELIQGDPSSDEKSLQLKIGNREIGGQDFLWLETSSIAAHRELPTVYVLERREHGNFYAQLKGLEVNAADMKAAGDLQSQFAAAYKASQLRYRQNKILEAAITNINGYLEAVQNKLLKTKAKTELRDLLDRQEDLKSQFETTLNQLNLKNSELDNNFAIFAVATGQEVKIRFSSIVRYYQPGQMGLIGKIKHYGKKVQELLFEEPRESNTEGGLFPAIFGTALLVFMMAITSFPLGVLGGVYLREYSQEGFLVNAVRIAVNNLAGIPSIVYGIFGLGFFIYGIGASIDQMFFAERLPESTFGTGGILWASMTLGILTIPVVIVATEEALGAIPAEVRNSSYALGATKLQTLLRVILPMASPGIMTGFILAMARAAGEVAPLMITGVVKLAPSLPIDGFWPFVHLDRKFMHLGFHIYDISSQSPNVEAAKPMVYVTTLLLIGIVVVMSGTAIWLRNRMRKKYQLSAL